MSIIPFRLVDVIEAIEHHVYKHGGYDDKYKKLNRRMRLLYEGWVKGWDDWSWGRAIMEGMLCKEDYKIFEELEDRNCKEDYNLYRNREKIEEGTDARTNLETRTSWASEKIVNTQERLASALSGLMPNHGYDTFEEFVQNAKSCARSLNEALRSLEGAKRDLDEGIKSTDDTIKAIDDAIHSVKQEHNIYEEKEEEEEEDKDS